MAHLAALVVEQEHLTVEPLTRAVQELQAKATLAVREFQMVLFHQLPEAAVEVVLVLLVLRLQLGLLVMAEQV